MLKLATILAIKLTLDGSVGVKY